MSTIKIEFPADRPDIAKILGEALVFVSEISTGGYKETVSDEVQRTSETEHGTATGGGTAATSQDAGSDDNGQFSKTEIDEQNNLVDPTVVDTKGVPFNAEFCSKAAKPFYASGKNSGQWKKRQGVEESAYDTWYMAELAKVVTSELDGPSQGGQAAVNTASAFGQDNQQQQNNNMPAAPHDAGSLMAWVSEMQTAGRINQQQVNDAYAQAGVTMTDVFTGPGKTVDTIAQAVGNVHNILVSWAG